MEFLRHLIGHKMVDLHMDESTGMLVIVTDYYDEDGQVALFCENVVYAVRAKPLIQ